MLLRSKSLSAFSLDLASAKHGARIERSLAIMLPGES